LDNHVLEETPYTRIPESALTTPFPKGSVAFRVLVVEDHPDTVNRFLLLLKLWGLDCCGCRNSVLAPEEE
jgi:hypothetical protein